MRLSNFAMCLLVPLMASGCGGSSGRRPGPLTTTIDEAKLATVTMDAKTDMLNKQNEYHIAKAAFQKASEDEKSYKHKEELAKNEKKKADIETESAKTKVTAAKASGDKESMNSAMSSMHSAQLQHDIADAHLDVARTQTKYLESAKNLSEEKMFWAQSKFELAKARLAVSNKVEPAEFSIGAFELQAKDRESRVASASKRTSALKKEADIAKQKWQALKSKVN